MTPLSARDFPAFFEAVHGVPPFPWQTRLAQRVATASRESPAWPDVVALPTASGKTSCIDIAVFALACQAHRPAGERTAARRIFFVVDRRVIVDEAYAHARRLADHLGRAEDGIARHVADALRHLAGGDTPLACAELRGGVYRDEGWVRSPIQPTVVASTVDQVGSRLFYRGYGLSPRSAPIHAGLVANDALIVLDEAHCANPFSQSLQAVRGYRQWAEQPVALPFDVVVMTATPRADDAQEVFGPDAADRAHPVLGRRLSAGKPARLLADAATSDSGFAAALAAQAHQMVSADRRAIAIMVNRVATAKAVRDALPHDEGDVVMLTGRMRPLDRDEVVRTWLERIAARHNRQSPLARPVFVVATQCLEVGADLDFDALVTECASLDALRQRFGRLNRMGRAITADAAIVLRATKSKDPDPIYGDALLATWDWLQEDGRGSVDMGVFALDERLADEAPGRRLSMLAPAPNAPVLLPAYLDAWVQTTPIPAPDPDVAIFLHGPARAVADVKVCWRADLAETPETWMETLTLCPPAAAECMPVPLWIVRRWLAEQRVTDRSGDIESAMAPEDDNETGEVPLVARRMVVRWYGPLDSEVTTDPAALRPGDTLVVPEATGGWEVFGHIPLTGSRTSVDRAEEACVAARSRAVLRLTAQAPWVTTSHTDPLRAFADVREIPEDLDALRAALRALADTRDLPAWLRASASALADDAGMDVNLHPAGGLVLEGSQRLVRDAGGEWLTSEGDRSSRGAAVGLVLHLSHVADEATRLLDRTGVSVAVSADLRLAASLHDVGKADPRFQALLYGGNPLSARAGTLLAKSPRLPGSERRRQEARRRSGYPDGGRHELLSVRLVESQPAILAAARDPDLVQYLIAAHHGHCRPHAPVVDDAHPVHVSLSTGDFVMEVPTTVTGMERLDSGGVERFWRLVRRYGWWGLAFYEATLRLADQRASEAEEQVGRARRRVAS